MVDFAECADLASHSVVSGSAIEQLERSPLALDNVAHPVDLRESAATQYLLNLESAADCVTYGVVASVHACGDFAGVRGWEHLATRCAGTALPVPSFAFELRTMR